MQRVKLSDVPIKVRRLAFQHLESLRGSGIGSNVNDLCIGPDVCPIYRPDVDNVAYFEFELLKSTGPAPEHRTDLVADVAKINVLTSPGPAKVYSSLEFPADRLSTLSPILGTRSIQGFIQVSTGEHDFPIPHWSLEHPPVSRELERQADIAKKKIARVLKLDALCYAAEDQSEAEVGLVGQRPVFTDNLPANLERFRRSVASQIPKPEPLAPLRQPDIEKVVDRKATFFRGARAIDLGFRAPDSLKEFKKQYKKAFKPGSSS
jgi:hypothetical protein